MGLLTEISSYLPYHFSDVVQLLKKKTAIDDLHTLDELSKFLTSDSCDFEQWMALKEDIQRLIRKCSGDKEGLDRFVTAVTAWGIKKDHQRLPTLITDFIPLDDLTEAIRHKTSASLTPFDNVLAWAAECSHSYPEFHHARFTSHLASEWRRYRPLILAFVPNIIDLFIGAFDFLDVRKKYTTLWDKNLLLEIVYKFFLIPSGVYLVLKPFIQSAVKLYLATAAVIVAAGLLIAIYKRWLRPKPDEIVNCTNMDKEIELGVIKPKVGQAWELQELMLALEADRPVLLVGLSGEGKTALMHHFAQLKKGNQLPGSLQDVGMFEMDCGLLVSSVTYGHSDLINQTKGQTEGFEKEILFFADEIDQIKTSEAAFLAFKKRLLEDVPRSKMVATVTKEKLDEIKKLDKDGSFLRRWKVIPIATTSEDQIRAILHEYLEREAGDIPQVTDEAIEETIKLGKQADFLPNVGLPAKIIDIIKEAVCRSRASFHTHFFSKEICDARQDIQNLKWQASRAVKIPDDLKKKICNQREKLKGLEKTFAEYKNQAGNIHRINAFQKKLNAVYLDITFELAKVFEEQKKGQGALPPVVRKDQVLFLWHYFYAVEMIKKELDQEIAKVRPHLPVQVDKELIQQVYQDLQLSAEKLSDAPKKSAVEVKTSVLDKILAASAKPSIAADPKADELYVE